MKVLCLDLEGVLVPEIWQAVAALTGVEILKKTTRDVPDYDELMGLRLEAMAEHDIRMSTIQEAIASLDPLEGAPGFLRWAQERFQIAILSDTYYEFAMPLMAKLDYPLLLCHHLEVANDRIVGYRLRQTDPKRHAVAAFRSLNLTVLAAGDSFNDVGMLQAADHGYFFNAPAAICERFPEIGAVEGYPALMGALEAHA